MSAAGDAFERLEAWTASWPEFSYAINSGPPEVILFHGVEPVVIAEGPRTHPFRPNVHQVLLSDTASIDVFINAALDRAEELGL